MMANSFSHMLLVGFTEKKIIKITSILFSISLVFFIAYSTVSCCFLLYFVIFFFFFILHDFMVVVLEACPRCVAGTE